MFTGGAPRQRLFRAGIDFASRRLIILDGMKEIASTAIDAAADRPISITVQANTKRGRFMVAAGGRTLQAKMPKNWDGFTAYGYGLSNSTVEFSKIITAAR